MCGLVGVAGNLEFKDEALIKRLLVLDYFRGTDSTGVAAVHNNGDVKVVKMASHPFNLFDSKKYGEYVSGYKSKVFIGHNRAATIGKTTDVNAHPFQFGDIVGAHNGTLDRPSWTRLEATIGQETNVDSAAIFASIDSVGIEDTIKLMETGRQSSHGAWALVWYDEGENTLNFLRNKHRPLWYAYTKDFKRVIWASEWPMIRAAIDLSSVPYELYVDEEGYSFFEVAEDKLYSFDMDALCAGYSTRPRPAGKTLKGREPAPVVAVGNPPFSAAKWNDTPAGGTSHSTTHSTTFHGETNVISCDIPAVVDLVGSTSSPLSSAISKQMFEDLSAHGCGWCGEKVEYDQVGVTVLTAYDTVMCPECSKNGDHTRIYFSYSDYEDWYKWKAA